MAKTLIFFIFAALTALITADFTPVTGPDVQKFDDECGLELKTTDERLQKFKKHEFEEDQESFCHVHCVAKKMKVFDDNDGTLLDNLVKQLLSNNDKPEPELRSIAENCKKESDDKKEDKCLWAFSGFMCLVKAELKASPDM